MASPPICPQVDVMNNELDKLIERPTTWEIALLFPCSTTPKDPSSFQERNILEYVSKKYRSTKAEVNMHFRLYFSPNVYFPDQSFSNHGHFPKLLGDLKKLAKDNGFEITSNGHSSTNGAATLDRKIMCTRGKKYYDRSHRNKSGDSEQEPQPKKRRGRKSSSKFAKGNECKCGMFFVIKCDENGFFVSNGQGRAAHTFHVQKSFKPHVVFYEKLLPRIKEFLPLVEDGAVEEGDELLTMIDKCLQKARRKISQRLVATEEHADGNVHQDDSLLSLVDPEGRLLTAEIPPTKRSRTNEISLI